MNCIFCQIINKQLPATITYEDPQVIAFKDAHPKAPIHQLIVPRQHIASLNELDANHGTLIGKLILIAKQLAKQFAIAESGYRTVFNCNKDAGQLVFHIHLHLLGGRLLHWPPG